MIRNNIFALALFGAVTATGAGLLYAQTHERGPGMMGSMMGMMADCPMMGAMAEGPAAALRHADELALTDVQVERLETIRATSAEAHRAIMPQMQQVHRQIRAATEGERFDEAAARAAFRAMGDLHIDMGVSMLRAGHEARAVLTSEQREKLAAKRPAGMMGGSGMGSMMGMMKDCPMMGGMMGGGMMKGGMGQSQEGN